MGPFPPQYAKAGRPFSTTQAHTYEHRALAFETQVGEDVDELDSMQGNERMAAGGQRDDVEAEANHNEVVGDGRDVMQDFSDHGEAEDDEDDGIVEIEEEEVLAEAEARYAQKQANRRPAGSPHGRDDVGFSLRRSSASPFLDNDTPETDVILESPAIHRNHVDGSQINLILRHNSQGSQVQKTQAARDSAEEEDQLEGERLNKQGTQEPFDNIAKHEELEEALEQRPGCSCGDCFLPPPAQRDIYCTQVSLFPNRYSDDAIAKQFNLHDFQTLDEWYEEGKGYIAKLPKLLGAMLDVMK